MDLVLKSLIRYQELSLELGRLNARLEQFPLQIKAIGDEVESAASALASARDALSEGQKERRAREAELQDLEGQFSKYNEQLMQVKTNNEYKAMQHAILGVKEQIGKVEERILLLMEEADDSDRKLKEDEKLLDGKRKEAEARKGVIGEERRQVEEEASRVAADHRAASEALGAEALELFNRIAHSRNGKAMARAHDERCQECNVRLRPHLFQEIKKNDHLIQCDSCRRILYYVAEAPTADASA